MAPDCPRILEILPGPSTGAVDADARCRELQKQNPDRDVLLLRSRMRMWMIVSFPKGDPTWGATKE